MEWINANGGLFILILVVGMFAIIGIGYLIWGTIEWNKIVTKYSKERNANNTNRTKA